MTVRAVDPARSRIVLIGAPVYDDPQLQNVPEVAHNLADLAALFTDTRLGGFPAGHCVTSEPDAAVDQVGDLIHEAAAQAEDLLLVYLAGHGLVGPRNELYLALRRTRYSNPSYSALRFETLRDTFLDPRTKAANRAVIIDSCFSGRAIGTPLAGGAETLADELEITGTYTLTAAPPNSVALALPGEAHTAFTGRLLRLLREGSPHGGDLLSLGEIYRHLHAQLRDDGLPMPQQRGTGTADLLGLVRNRHPRRAGGRQESVLQQRAFAALDEAKRVAASLDWESRIARALTEMATVIATVDPDLAERIIAGISDMQYRAPALADLAEVVTAVDPRRGEMIGEKAAHAALGIADEHDKVRALVDITKVIAIVGRERAADIANEVERAARAISTGLPLARTLIEIAQAVAATDRNRAADIAERALRPAEDITGELRDSTLAEAAQVIAASNPDRALRIASSVHPGYPKANVLTKVASVVAVTDPDRAERIVAAIDDSYMKAEALAEIARVVGATDRIRAAAIADQAELAIAGRVDGYFKPKAQTKIARAVAVADPGRAEQITNDMGSGSIACEARAEIAKVIAATDPGRAEHIAANIDDSYDKAEALAEIARGIAATNRGRAAAIARQADRAAADIYNEDRKTRMLTELAGLVAIGDPDRAEEIAAAIDSETLKAQVLVDIAGAVAVDDPDRAEQIAATIADPSYKVRALAGSLVAQCRKLMVNRSTYGRSARGCSFAQRHETAIIAVSRTIGIRLAELADVGYDPDAAA